jgi:hypothetical protein
MHFIPPGEAFLSQLLSKARPSVKVILRTSVYLSSIQLLCLALVTPFIFAQSGAPKTPQVTASLKKDSRPAQQLYDEANNYVSKKYEDFNLRNVAFDPRLESATRQEQKDLAARLAATLIARADLKANDLYYLGMLYHLADDSDGAHSNGCAGF